jgi:hypothetical protein
MAGERKKRKRGLGGRLVGKEVETNPGPLNK